MIAPKDFTAEHELYLYITDRVIQNFGIESEGLPKGEDLNLPSRECWWSVWRCEVIITDPQGEFNIVLFSNFETALSFVCGGHAEDFESIVQEFQAAFLTYLKTKGVQLPAHVDTKLTLMTDEPEEFTLEVDWMIECLKRDLIDRKISPLIAQERLNANPICELGGGSPNDYFFELAEKHPPFGAEFIPSEGKAAYDAGDNDEDGDVPF
ncbi:MAG: hypothetical protein ACSHX8_03525 [Opitutaceae bacterium]